MTDRALDNLARRVMLDAARQEYGSLMAELPEHDFSPEFEKRMGRLVRRAARPIRHRAPRPEGASVTQDRLRGRQGGGAVPAGGRQ